MQSTFTALVIQDGEHGRRATFQQIGREDLPDHDVLVEVQYSSLNYKDALAISGKQKIARKTPLIAGIDLAGIVVESRDHTWAPGARVMVNGWGLSETQSGGFTRYQRVKPEWLTRIPDAFSAKQVMAIGTAGYTAALCVDALDDWGMLGERGMPILVTGASGGVGSVAVALLHAAGFAVTAASGRSETADYLRELGAAQVINRKLLEEPGGPLQKEQWSGCVDSVGGPILVNALSQTVYGGAVAACGLAASPALPKATVLPHILRGVALLGVDSVMAPSARRDRAWARLARDLPADALEALTTVESMSALPALADKLLAGQTRGRIVIQVGD